MDTVAMSMAVIAFIVAAVAYSEVSSLKKKLDMLGEKADKSKTKKK